MQTSQINSTNQNNIIYQSSISSVSNFLLLDLSNLFRQLHLPTEDRKFDTLTPPSNISSAKALKQNNLLRMRSDLLLRTKGNNTHIVSIEEQMANFVHDAKELFYHDETELEKYGEKHANLVRLSRLTDGLQLEAIEVPIPHGIKSDVVEVFLRERKPDIFKKWEMLKELYSKHKEKKFFLQKPDVMSCLDSIALEINAAFYEAALDDNLFEKLNQDNLREWLAEVENNKNFLMVRSSGSEDSRKSANAGGNISCAYVAPTVMAFCRAAGKVIASYFSYSSLQNRINADENPFSENIKLSVTSQELIGEPVNEKSYQVNEIPISLVLFTSEPLYVGDENFRVMRISSTYGHGEGVVGKKGIASDTILLLVSEKHPDRLYIMYDNQLKPERLAPINVNEQVLLTPFPNSKKMSKQRTLDPAMLGRLYLLGILTEKFFDHKATEMEIVIKGEKIYPVQARPINRLPLLPTYVDRKKIADFNMQAEMDILESETLVAGRGNAIVIKNSDEICFARSLLAAERAYDSKLHKLVVVAQPEPSNSHSIVNFSGYGVTCLRVNDAEMFSNLLNQTSLNRPMVCDSQTGDIFLWNGEPSPCISTGFAVHPAKIALSTSAANLKSSKSHSSQMLQDVKELLIAVRRSETHEIACERLSKLPEMTPIINLKKLKNTLKAETSTQISPPKRTLKALSVLESIENTIKIHFNETVAAYQQADPAARLKPLFWIKALEVSLLGPKNRTKSGIGQYSLADTEVILEDAMILIDYQKKFTHPVHFSKIYLAGKRAVHPASCKAWSNFLEKLEDQVESGAVSQEKVQKLHELIITLEKSKSLDLFFVYFFPLPPQPMPSIEEILNLLPQTEKKEIDDCFQIMDRIEKMYNSIDRFADPNAFPEAYYSLSQLLAQLVEPSFIKAGQSKSCLVQSIVFTTLRQTVELYDSSIKEMKSSTSYSNTLKINHFKNMLIPYLFLLETWLMQYAPLLQIPHHSDWPIHKYIEEISKRFQKKIKNLNYNNQKQLSPSKNFSVNAAVVGSATNFSRHYPETLEDFFTLIHQNLIVLSSRFTSQYILNNQTNTIGLPTEIQTFMRIFLSGLVEDKIYLTHIEIHESEITINYNIPMNSHSSTLQLKYNRDSHQSKLVCYFMGESRERWNTMALWAKLLHEFGEPCFTLSYPPHKTSQELKLEWNLKSADDLKNILQNFNTLCRMTCLSFGTDELIELCRNKIKIPADQILKWATEQFPQSKRKTKELLLRIIYKSKHDIDQSTINFLVQLLEENRLFVRDEALRILDSLDSKYLPNIIEIIAIGILPTSSEFKRKSCSLLACTLLKKRDPSLNKHLDKLLPIVKSMMIQEDLVEFFFSAFLNLIEIENSVKAASELALREFNELNFSNFDSIKDLSDALKENSLPKGIKEKAIQILYKALCSLNNDST